jgi:hypothetical protein
LRIAHDLERLLETLEVVRADQDRSRFSVACHDHALLSLGDEIDDLGEASLDVGQRKGLRHDQDSSLIRNYGAVHVVLRLVALVGATGRRFAPLSLGRATPGDSERNGRWRSRATSSQ